MSEESKPVLSFKVSTQKSEDVKPAVETINVDVPNPSLAEKAEETFNDIQSRFSSFNIKKFIWVIPVLVLIGAGVAGYHYDVHNTAYDKAKETVDYVWSSRLGTESKPVPEPKPEAPVKVEDDEPKRSKVGVLEARDFYLRISKSNGSIEVRTGGSRSWRLNNPCTILHGKFAVTNGAIGRADKFAVFESYDDGRKACYELLFDSDHGYKDKSIQDAIKRFAPANEGFKTLDYIKAVRVLNVPMTTKMSDLSEAKRNKLIDILMDVEDFIPGKVFTYDSASDFKKRGY